MRLTHLFTIVATKCHILTPKCTCCSKYLTFTFYLSN